MSVHTKEAVCPLMVQCNLPIACVNDCKLLPNPARWEAVLESGCVAGMNLGSPISAACPKRQLQAGKQKKQVQGRFSHAHIAVYVQVLTEKPIVDSWAVVMDKSGM